VPVVPRLRGPFAQAGWGGIFGPSKTYQMGVAIDTIVWN
jgi:hypothetical protein